MKTSPLSLPFVLSPCLEISTEVPKTVVLRSMEERGSFGAPLKLILWKAPTDPLVDLVSTRSPFPKKKLYSERTKGLCLSSARRLQ